MKNIIFFYPSKTVGGAEFLFARIAKELSKSYNCYIVDYNDGIFRTINPKFKESNYIDYSKNPQIPNNSYIVTYPPMIFDMLRYFKDTNNIKKVLLWSVHPNNFESLIPFYRVNRILFSVAFNKILAKTIDTLNKKNSLLLMDGAMKEYFEKLYYLDDSITKKFSYLPIPVKLSNLTKEYNENEYKEKLKFCWLGRLSNEKIFSALKVLNDLNKIKNIEIELDIIGDGEEIHRLKSLELNSNILINYLGVIVDDLDSYLIEYDIIFATGTSTLEGAKLKVPSILLDDSYTFLPENYRYKWIYDTKDYVLGSFIPSSYQESNNLTMQDIIVTLLNQNKKIDVANRCYDYVVNNHSLNVVANRLIIYLDSSTLTIKELKKIPINCLYVKILYKLRAILKK